MGTQGQDGKVAGWVGCFVVALIGGCVGLTLLGGAGPDARPEATPEQMDAKMLAAQTAFGEMLKSGAVRKVDFVARAVWVDPLTWAACNRDIKVGFINNVAGHMEGMTGSFTVTVRSYGDDARLGRFSPVSGAVILQ